MEEEFSDSSLSDSGLPIPTSSSVPEDLPDFDGFLSTIATIPTAAAHSCGRQLRYRELAFSCRTCGLDDACIMCAECFDPEQHRDHEFRSMSSGGGTCDCGDPEAWRPSGFCARHSGTHVEPPAPDARLVAAADAFFPSVMAYYSEQLRADAPGAFEPLERFVEALPDDAKRLFGRAMLAPLAEPVAAPETTWPGDLEPATTYVELFLLLDHRITSAFIDAAMAAVYCALIVYPSFKRAFSAAYVRYYPLIVHTYVSHQRRPHALSGLSVQILSTRSIMYPDHVSTDSPRNAARVVIGQLRAVLRMSLADPAVFAASRFHYVVADLGYLLSTTDVADAIVTLPGVVADLFDCIAVVAYGGELRRRMGEHVGHEDRTLEVWLFLDERMCAMAEDLAAAAARRGLPVLDAVLAAALAALPSRARMTADDEAEPLYMFLTLHRFVGALAGARRACFPDAAPLDLPAASALELAIPVVRLNAAAAKSYTNYYVRNGETVRIVLRAYEASQFHWSAMTYDLAALQLALAALTDEDVTALAQLAVDAFAPAGTADHLFHFAARAVSARTAEAQFTPDARRRELRVAVTHVLLEADTPHSAVVARLPYALASRLQVADVDAALADVAVLNAARGSYCLRDLRSAFAELYDPSYVLLAESHRQACEERASSVSARNSLFLPRLPPPHNPRTARFLAADPLVRAAVEHVRPARLLVSAVRHLHRLASFDLRPLPRDIDLTDLPAPISTALKSFLPLAEPAPVSDPEPSSDPDSAKRRQAEAKRRQEEVRARFLAKQAEFAGSLDEDIDVVDQLDHQCVICLMNGSDETPVCSMAFVETSAVTITAARLASTTSVTTSVTTIATTSTTTYELLRTLDGHFGLHVSSCMHFVHADCIRSYIESNPRPLSMFYRQRVDYVKNDEDEFLCPMCRTCCNILLPESWATLSNGPVDPSSIDDVSDFVDAGAASAAITVLPAPIHLSTPYSSLVKLLAQTIAPGTLPGTPFVLSLLGTEVAAEELAMQRFPDRHATLGFQVDRYLALAIAELRVDLRLYDYERVLWTAAIDGMRAGDADFRPVVIRAIACALARRAPDDAARWAAVAIALQPASRAVCVRLLGAAPPDSAVASAHAALTRAASSTSRDTDWLDTARATLAGYRPELLRNVARASRPFDLAEAVRPSMYQMLDVMRGAGATLCTSCGRRPDYPGLCMLCGRLLCLGRSCCVEDNVTESVRHACGCSAGLGLILLVRSTLIAVLKPERKGAALKSLYLDRHHEEDVDLARGAPLHLRQDRYDDFVAAFLSHSLDSHRPLHEERSNRFRWEDF